MVTPPLRGGEEGGGGCSSGNERGAERVMGYLSGFQARTAIEEVELYLYPPTDTATSLFCARAIQEYIKTGNLGRRTGLPPLGTTINVNDPITLRGFSRFGDETNFNDGLTDLLDKVARLITSKRRDGYKVVANPTGGFKAETAYFTLIAMLAGAWRIIYMHESMKQVVELPSLPPITLDHMYAEELKRLGESKIPPASAARQLVDLNDLKERLLVAEEDGMVKVNEWARKLIEY